MVGFIIAILVLLLIVTIIFVCTLKNNSGKNVDKLRINNNQIAAKSFGKAGENFVASKLQEIVVAYGGYLYNDFCFEDEEGYSTEIDHILINRGGIFIIETKTNKGIIKGNKDDEWWTSIKNDYQDNKRLKNPIIQNQGHINHLRKMFKKTPPHMFSVVIFPLADVRNVSNNIVYNLNDGLQRIIELTKTNHYSLEFVERTNKEIAYIKEKNTISKEKHVKNIEKFHNNYQK